jgi:hypothetical protein
MSGGAEKYPQIETLEFGGVSVRESPAQTSYGKWIVVGWMYVNYLLVNI